LARLGKEEKYNLARMTPEPKSIVEMTDRYRARYYPNLRTGNYHKTSEETNIYNCVAWVFNIKTEPIDLSVDENGDPMPVPQYLMPQVYIEYFEQRGFTKCDTPDLEAGIEKIALYVHTSGTFEHVALQLENGNWSSKVGEYEDIEHYNLEAIEKPDYMGIASIFMKRERKK
jgi:hypothetical protein